MAAEAARFLAAQVTMMNHKGAAAGHVHGDDDPVSRATQTLRNALSDPREDVRSIAATTLASMGDQTALQRLREAYEKGHIKDAEAVRCLTLAEAEVGASYVERGLLTTGAGATTSRGATRARAPPFCG